MGILWLLNFSLSPVRRKNNIQSKFKANSKQINFNLEWVKKNFINIVEDEDETQEEAIIKGEDDMQFRNILEKIQKLDLQPCGRVTGRV